MGLAWCRRLAPRRWLVFAGDWGDRLTGPRAARNRGRFRPNMGRLAHRLIVLMNVGINSSVMLTSTMAWPIRVQ